MFPKLVLCEEHPVAHVALSSGKTVQVSVSPDKTRIDLTTSATEKPDAILLIPYYGAYIMKEQIKPLKTGDVEYLQILLETRKVLKLYEVQISKGKISIVSHLPDDNFFRGYVKSCEEVDKIFKRIFKKLIRQYLQLSIPICCAVLKIIAQEDSIEDKLDLLTKLSHKRTNGASVDLYFGPGRCMFIRKVGARRFNISLIFSITYSSEFLDILLKLYDISYMINDFRLGRIEKTEKSTTVLDLFTVSIKTSRFLSYFTN